MLLKKLTGLRLDLMCCCLLGYDTVSSARSLPVFQENSSTVKVQAVCSTEIAVLTYQTRRCHNPEIQNPRQKIAYFIWIRQV